MLSKIFDLAESDRYDLTLIDSILPFVKEVDEEGQEESKDPQVIEQESNSPHSVFYAEDWIEPSETTGFTTDPTTFNQDRQVQIRVLSDIDLGIDFTTADGKKTKKVLINPLNQSLPPLRAKVKKVLVHFHGGAFVALNSGNHEVYLSNWAQ
jgi:acetyl esterase/lipase